jgi:hypothetical protein
MSDDLLLTILQNIFYITKSKVLDLDTVHCPTQLSLPIQNARKRKHLYGPIACCSQGVGLSAWPIGLKLREPARGRRWQGLVALLTPKARE